MSDLLAEIDISVSKLLGFETVANFLSVLVSVSENLVSEKKSRYRFRSKFWYRHSVPVTSFTLSMFCNTSVNKDMFSLFCFVLEGYNSQYNGIE